MTRKSKPLGRPQPANQHGPGQPQGKGGHASVQQGARARGPDQPPAPVDPWWSRSAKELVAAQGVPPVERPEELEGQGADLWDDDADFDRFLEWLRETRRAGR
jgi:hypothetical protein